MDIAGPLPERRQLPFTNKLSGMNLAPWSRDTSRPASPLLEAQEDALINAGKAKPRQPISRKHVEQSMRLFGETLQEDLTSDYAFDLHFSAVDYSLRALPENSFDDAPARKANIRRRLTKLSEQVGVEPSGQPNDARWWQRTSSQDHTMSRSNADGSLELLGTCPCCATKVPVHVPAWMSSGATQKKAPSTYEELAVGAVVGLAVMIKQSPIPLLFGSVFQLIMQGIFYLDHRFAIHQRLLLLLGGVIETLVLLDRELGILRRFGELAHKLWEIGISAMLAFARAEGYQPPTQYAPQRQLPPPQLTAYPPATTAGAGSGISQAPPPSYFSQPAGVTRSASVTDLSSGHGKRASWHGNTLAPPERSLRRPASTDGLYGSSQAEAAAAAAQQPDSDGESTGGGGASSRKRTESWASTASNAAGKALSMVPGVPGRR